MLEIGKFIHELTRKVMTPQYVAQVDKDIQEGLAKTKRAALAMDGVAAGLTPEENQLADQFEEAIFSGQEASEVPGAREAFEKRTRLVEEAIQGA